MKQGTDSITQPASLVPLVPHNHVLGGKPLELRDVSVARKMYGDILNAHRKAHAGCDNFSSGYGYFLEEAARMRSW